MSLWLYPSTASVVVSSNRFRDYPFFFETLEQYYRVPSTFVVRWERYSKWTKYLIEADNEEAADEVEAFIDDVTARMRDGEDIPPLIRDGRKIADGRHRAFAAEALKLKLAPVVNAAEWK